MLKGIKCKVQGADHIAKNKVCQDASGVFYNENYALAVVADGHGSEKYIRSEIGSQFAVESVRETIDAYMSDINMFSKAIKNDQDYICKKIQEQFLTRWFIKIEDYKDNNPLTENEIEILKREKASEREFSTHYGSTILFAVMTKEYHFGMLVGDGGFIVVNSDGSVKCVIEDENSFANYCSSICSRNSITEFQKYFEYGNPISITVSTDGLIKSFASEEDFEDYHLLLASMLDDTDACSASLEKNLHNRTHAGSGDDISVAVIFDTEIINKQKKIIKKCVEEGKKRRKEDAKAKKKAQEEQARKMTEKEEAFKYLVVEQEMDRQRMQQQNISTIKRSKQSIKNQNKEQTQGLYRSNEIDMPQFQRWERYKYPTGEQSIRNIEKQGQQIDSTAMPKLEQDSDLDQVENINSLLSSIKQHLEKEVKTILGETSEKMSKIGTISMEEIGVKMKKIDEFKKETDLKKKKR